MKEDELRKHAICSACKNKIGHTHLPMFWTLNIKRHGLLKGALERNAGLFTMLGGSAELARVMGPDEDMTKILLEEKITLCETCAMPIMILLESRK